EPKAHPRIPLPADLYGAQRRNSQGVVLADDEALRSLGREIAASPSSWQAQPLVPGASAGGSRVEVTNPADRRQSVGAWIAADAATAQRALSVAWDAQPAWDRRGGVARAAIIE